MNILDTLAALLMLGLLGDGDGYGSGYGDGYGYGYGSEWD